MKSAVVIDTSDMVSFNIPAYEPTKKSYIINAVQTGTVISRVSFGLFTQSDTVTTVDAHIGKRLSADFHEKIATAQPITINITGHIKEFAHFLSLFIKIVSRNIPIILGIAPATAPRQI